MSEMSILGEVASLSVRAGDRSLGRDGKITTCVCQRHYYDHQ